MLTPHDAAFLGVVVLLALAPGPDLALVLHACVSGGRGAGRAAALGTGCGSLLQGTAALAGVGALVAGAGPLLEALRWAGVAYLAVLGVRAILTAVVAGPPPPPAPEPAPVRDPHRARAFGRGLAGNLANPKVLLFSLAVLPGLLPPGRSHLGPVLAVVALPLLGTGWLLVVVAAARRLDDRLGTGRARRPVEVGVGLAMLGLAAGVAVS